MQGVIVPVVVLVGVTGVIVRSLGFDDEAGNVQIGLAFRADVESDVVTAGMKHLSVVQSDDLSFVDIDWLVGWLLG